MQCALPLVAWGLIHRMLVVGRTRSLFGLTSLNRGFLIGTDDPDALPEQRSGLFIQLEHRAGALQKDLGILDAVPGMGPPGADLLNGEASPNGCGIAVKQRRSSRQRGVMTHVAPPSLVGKRSHLTGLSLYNASAHAIYSSRLHVALIFLSSSGWKGI